MQNKPLSDDKKEFQTNLIAIIVTIFQPIFWYGMYGVFAFIFGGHWLLVIACILSLIASIIGILWLRNWVVNNEDFFDD